MKFHNSEEQAGLSWANKQILMIQTENNAICIDVLCVGVSLLMAFKLNDRAAHGHLRVDGGLPPKVDWSKWTPVGARSKVRGGNIVCGSPTVGPEGLNAYVESKIDEVFQTIGSWPDSTQVISEFSRVDIVPLCDHVTCLCIKDVGPCICETDYLGLEALLSDFMLVVGQNRMARPLPWRPSSSRLLQ